MDSVTALGAEKGKKPCLKDWWVTRRLKGIKAIHKRGDGYQRYIPEQEFYYIQENGELFCKKFSTFTADALIDGERNGESSTDTSASVKKEMTRLPYKASWRHTPCALYKTNSTGHARELLCILHLKPTRPQEQMSAFYALAESTGNTRNVTKAINSHALILRFLVCLWFDFDYISVVWLAGEHFRYKRRRKEDKSKIRVPEPFALPSLQPCSQRRDFNLESGSQLFPNITPGMVFQTTCSNPSQLCNALDWNQLH